MIDLDAYFRHANDSAYVGQLTPAFQSALAERYAAATDAACDFVQAIDVGGGRSLSGPLDLRGIEDTHLGGTPVWGRRVIEFGPGSGWISAHLAIRADELVVVDLPPGTAGEQPADERRRKGWWFVRAALGFDAQVVYAPPVALPGDLGRFDVAVFTGLLDATPDPHAAMRAAATITDDTIVVALPWEADGDMAPDRPLARFVQDDRDAPHWLIAPGAVVAMLAGLGFAQQTVTTHRVPRHGVPSLHYTVVARRQAAGVAAVTAMLPADLHAQPAAQPASPAPSATPPPSRAATAATSVPVAQQAAGPAPQAALPAVDLADIVADDLPLPTARGRFLVAGTDDVEVFVVLGRAGYGAIRATLHRAGVDQASLGRVLDFGCGVGRVLRYWKASPAVEMHGTDLNADAIAWCRDNLGFARFATNGLEPRLDYPDNHFGLVYALSVFTHLPEDMQVPWLAELMRIVRPGGHLYFTTHGLSYRAALPPPMREIFDADRLVGGGADAGSNYYGTFHPSSYVRRAMLDPLGLVLVDFQPEGAKGNPTQDSWLVRKP